MSEVEENQIENSVLLELTSGASYLNIEQVIGANSDALPARLQEFSELLQQFLNNFNSSYRLDLLNCKKSETNDLMYLLNNLNKSIGEGIHEIGDSLRNRQYSFKCGLCNQDIIIGLNQDIWSRLQDHEHFEDLFYHFLQNQKNVEPSVESVINDVQSLALSESDSSWTSDNETDSECSNSDSGLEQQTMEPSTSRCYSSILTNKSKFAPTTDDNANIFRFNFKPTYDNEVESKLYPSSLMENIRKYDKVKEFSIMRSGAANAACLICHCEINGQRISRNSLVNHTMGQKHLRAARHQETLNVLGAYHAFWLKQEPAIQAHQVYLRPLPHSLKMECLLCKKYVAKENVLEHIRISPHRNAVLQMYEHRNNLVYLVSLQVQVYGISQEDVERRENLDRKKQEKEQVVREKSSSETVEETNKSTPNKGHPIPKEKVHKIINAIEDIESPDPIKRLPNRMKSEAAHLQRITVPVRNHFENRIFCNRCVENVKDDFISIRNHILSGANHAFKTKELYKYFCEMCSVRLNSEIDWINHFMGRRHVNPTHKLKLKEYECVPCKTVIFGDQSSLTRHLSIGGNRKKEKADALPVEVKSMLASKQTILDRAKILRDAAEDVIVNLQTKICCDRLEASLSILFGQCKVYPFGSRISGIGNKDSDLDVFIDLGGTYFGENYQDPNEQVAFIRRATKIVVDNKNHQSPREFCQARQVLTARTPILTLHHTPTNLDCDLSFKHGLSVENTKFLRLCLVMQPTCQELILLVKRWAGLIIFDRISTYALAIMCIFYMQLNGHLLSVEEIRRLNKVQPATINGWRTLSFVLSTNDMKKYTKPYEKSCYDLLKEFFAFYWKFDFNTYVICPLLGQVVRRALFSEGNPNDLPPEMAEYVAQLEREDGELFRSNSYMCVQDPFDLSHNLTKAVQPNTLKKFQSRCKLSLELINNSEKEQ